MRRVLSRVARAADSPTLLRDLSSLVSPWRVGAWFTVLNAALGTLLGGAVFLWAVEGDRTLTQLSAALGLGQSLACLLLLGLGAICTVLVPIRAAGLFEGPRWGRYFDQVVLSGISPLRYFAGKVLAMNVFFAVIVVASLPYAIFSLSLGGVQIGFVVLGVASLWLYANLLTFSTLAIAVFAHDVASAAGVIAVFAVLFGVGLAPLPPICGLLAPSHYLTDPIWDLPFFAGQVRWGISATVFTVRGVSITLGSLPVFVAGALSGCALAAGALALGPPCCLVKVNSTFGEIVMPGDSKRPSILRRRQRLRRRSELSFFYENRSAWMERWEGLFRYGSALFLLFLLAGIPLGILHYVSASYRPPELHLSNLITLTSCLLMGGVVFSSDRCTMYTQMHIGRRSFSAARLDTIGFVIFLVIVGLAVWGVPELRTALSGTSWLRRGGVEALWLRGERLHRLTPLVLLLMVQQYVLLRTLAMRRWERGGALVASCFLAIVFWAGPVALGNLVRMLGPRAAGLMPLMVRLAVFSPVSTIHEVVAPDSYTGWVVGRGRSALVIAPAAHAVVTICLALLAWRYYVRSRPEVALESKIREEGDAAA